MDGWNWNKLPRGKPFSGAFSVMHPGSGQDSATPGFPPVAGEIIVLEKIPKITRRRAFQG
jgi:hypothetical protein